jgi:hypothetical protein
MNVEDITVEVRGADLIRVGQLTAEDLSAFLCVLRVNSLGSWSVKLPNAILNEDGVWVTHELCAALRAPNAGLVVTGPGWVLSGPMEHAEINADASDPDGTWTIEGVTDAVVLDHKLAYPNPNIAGAQESSQNRPNDVRTAAAETLMLQYVNLNIGPGAPAARQEPGLSVDIDLGRGITLTKSPRFQNLLELLQEIATSSNLLFDVVQVGDGIEFQVSDPIDASLSERWDIDNDQLDSVKYGFSAPTVTHVVVAAQGEGSERIIIEVTTPASLAAAAVWGRRELFVDQRNTDDLAELLQAGLDALAEGVQITSLQLVPSADLADGFGERWSLGSTVTAVVGVQEVTAPVSEAAISITTDGVFVGAVVGDPTGFEWESLLATRQSAIDKRVSALERT